MFELVRESRNHYPELCIKALKALLDLLQGQQPEGMKKEPPEIVGEWFHSKYTLNAYLVLMSL